MIEFINRNRILRFFITGTSGAAIHIGLLYIFTEFFGWWYLASATVAFLLALAFGFTAHKFWTFGDSSTHWIHGQLALYLTLMLFNLLANNTLLFILVEKFQIWYVLAQAIVNAVIAVWSFFAYKRLFHNENPI